MSSAAIDALISQLSRLPGLGPRSARRAALHLLERRQQALLPLVRALTSAADSLKICRVCGNFSAADPCPVCADPRRDNGLLCVVQDVSGLWAMERSGAFSGRYHVLGGLLSALDGIGPEDLRIDQLLQRVGQEGVREVILATPATVDGQTTAFYLADRLQGLGADVSVLAQGVPVGGDIESLDDGTIGAALRARRPLR